MKKPYVALVALVLFSMYTATALFLAEQSLLEFGFTLMSNPDTAQVVIDLYLLAGMACIWMYRDARAKGRSLMSLVPYILITVVFVSIGPLLYIVVTGFGRQSKRSHGVLRL